MLLLTAPHRITLHVPQSARASRRTRWQHFVRGAEVGEEEQQPVEQRRHVCKRVARRRSSNSRCCCNRRVLSLGAAVAVRLASLPPLLLRCHALRAVEAQAATVGFRPPIIAVVDRRAG